MKHSKFVVSPFENRNGLRSWRVDGYLGGVRIRRNFKTREEAAAEQAALEIKALNAANGLHTIATVLTTEQVREAEAVFHRLGESSRSLSFYVDYALANYRQPEHQKLLADAITDYVAARKHEFAQDQLSAPQMKRIGNDLKRLSRHFKGKSVADLTVPALIGFLEVGRPSMKTHNNRRGIVSTFLKYAFQRGWLAENPIFKVPHYRIKRKRGMASTLTAAQARELMHHFETVEGGRWVPYFALCLFAGIRPSVPHGEITRLKATDVNLETGIISISAHVSKVREPRRITIQPNLAAWLRAYPLDRFPIVPGSFQKRRAKIKKQFALTHDVLRHTYISMFVGKFRSIGEAAIQAGNSESIIRKHYLDLKTPTEAEEFFGILPKHPAGANVGELVSMPPALGRAV
jgi:integrase